MTRIKTALMGCGSWGKNHARALIESPRTELKFLCDQSPEVLEKNIPGNYPGRKTQNVDEVLKSDVDAVIIATPVPSHYELARQALEHGKHVLVEKPICLRSKEAEELIAIAARKNLRLMVGHLMYFHPTIQELHRRVEQGEFGKLRFVRSERLNSGVVRSNENVWESLAPHDLSLLALFLGTKVKKAEVSGTAFLQPGIPDIAMGHFEFEDGGVGQVSVSWLDPIKVRRLTLVGERKMAVLNDIPGGGLEVFDLRVERQGSQFKFVQGGVEKVPLSTSPALQIELDHFLDSIESGKTPITDGHNGLVVLRWLEEGTRQIRG